MNRALTAFVSAAALALPTAEVAAAAAKPKKVVKVSTRTILGTIVQADRWGPLQVEVKFRITTTKRGAKKSIVRKIANIVVPTYPDHTGRSQYINQTALPWLIQEAMKAQSANVQLISGATYSSEAFVNSLQGAISAAALSA
ncbi:MAG: FMN-binding protein [Gaiellaceae bacterium]